MAWTQTDLATIEAAIASGTLSVRFSDGRQVTYHSLDSMIRARSIVWAALNGAAATPVNRSAFADVHR